MGWYSVSSWKCMLLCLVSVPSTFNLEADTMPHLELPSRIQIQCSDGMRLKQLGSSSISLSSGNASTRETKRLANDGILGASTHLLQSKVLVLRHCYFEKKSPLARAWSSRQSRCSNCDLACILIIKGHPRIAQHPSCRGEVIAEVQEATHDLDRSTEAEAIHVVFRTRIQQEGEEQS
uniref:Cyanovirin-N domain-containing protein n=1 Tax=Bionectria ochroleuca TaxID=29856 RepID=A0A8H7N2B9_BIOOC